MENLAIEVITKTEEVKKKSTLGFFKLPEAVVRLWIICAGGCGANAASAMIKTLSPKDHPHLYLLVLESDARVLERHFVREDDPDNPETVRLFEWFESGQLKIIALGKGRGAGGNSQTGRKLLEDNIEKVDQNFGAFEQPVDAALVVTGLGGGTGGGVAPYIVGHLKKHNIPTCAIAAIPGLEEGAERVERANTVKAELLQLCPTILLYNDEVVDLTMTDAQVYDEINHACLFPVIKFLRSLIQDVGNVRNVDLNDLIAVLGKGNHALPGYCDATNGPIDLERQLLGSPYLKSEIMKTAVAVILWFEGVWTVEERREVMDLLEARMDHKVEDKGVELKYGVIQTGVEGEKRSVGFLAIGSEPPTGSGRAVKKSSNVTINVPAAIEPAEPLRESEKESVPKDDHNNGYHHVNGFPPPIPVDLVEFKGNVNGEVSEPVMVSRELATAYNRLCAKNPSTKVSAEALEVQANLEKATGIKFDLPGVINKEREVVSV